MSPKNKPRKVLTLKKLLKVVISIKKSAPDSYPTGKPKYPDAYSKLSTMKPSPQKKVVYCKICKVELNAKNRYAKTTNLQCKACFKEYQKSLWSKFRETRNRRKVEYLKKYSQTDKGKEFINARSKRAYKKHTVKWLARAKLREEVKRGRIKKPVKCESCREVKPLQGHHPDYAKPLQVKWLCHRCHMNVHYPPHQLIRRVENEKETKTKLNTN